ncbi:hypothetical protein P3T76_012954 [Phytophthora citrophthora]|uniref:RxLR effector protein n=1 Tax=Phytophthora citrophthora TaxID=4793 RepID=A0AAD9LCQ7_9STRA|nr:hypothetical protein P3T76_012954 [Phytophthora citrophthora]
MRLSYILAVVLVAILQASGTANPMYEDPKQIVSADAAGGAAMVDDGRLLRGVEKKMKAEEEERFFKNFGTYLKKIPGKMKDSWKVKKAKEQLERSRKRRQHIREQGFTPLN